MRVSDLTFSSDDKTNDSKRLVKTEKTNAVNAGLVGNSDKSELTLKPKLFATSRDNVGKSTVQVTQASQLKSSKDKSAVSSKGNSNSISTNKVGAKSAVSASKSKGASAVAKKDSAGRNVKSLVSTQLEGTELDGTTKIYETSNTAYKMAKSANRAYVKHKEKQSAKDVVQTKTGREIAEETNTSRNKVDSVVSSSGEKSNYKQSRAKAKASGRVSGSAGKQSTKDIAQTKTGREIADSTISRSEGTTNSASVKSTTNKSVVGAKESGIAGGVANVARNFSRAQLKGTELEGTESIYDASKGTYKISVAARKRYNAYKNKKLEKLNNTSQGTTATNNATTKGATNTINSTKEQSNILINSTTQSQNSLGVLSQKKYVAQKATQNTAQAKAKQQMAGYFKKNVYTTAAKTEGEKKIAGGVLGKAKSLLATVGSSMLPIILGLVGMFLICGIFSSLFSSLAGDDTNDVGTLEGIPAEIATKLKEYGYSDEAIAGVLGNMYGEKEDFDASYDGPDSLGIMSLGIMQFSGSNRLNYLDWCSANNKEWNTVATQVEWAFSGEDGTNCVLYDWMTDAAYKYDVPSELNDRLKRDVYQSGEDFKTSTDVDLACFSFMAAYERCGYSEGISHFASKRLPKAREFYEKLKSGWGSGTGNAEVVKRAYDYVGKAEYEWGACSPGVFDCSGFVSYCLTGNYSKLGTTYTFLGYQQVSDPQPGDIAVNEDHCGIYIGNGQMIHCATYGVGVIVGPVQSGMVYTRYNG